MQRNEKEELQKFQFNKKIFFMMWNNCLFVLPNVKHIRTDTDFRVIEKQVSYKHSHEIIQSIVQVILQLLNGK